MVPCFNLEVENWFQKLVSFVEVTNIRTYSRKTNKLQNVYTIGKGGGGKEHIQTLFVISTPSLYDSKRYM